METPPSRFLRSDGMKPVTRLPVQHRNHPRCDECQLPLPTLNGFRLELDADQMANVDILTITFRVRCKCGKIWDLTKTVKSE